MPYPRHKARPKPISCAPKDGTQIYVINPENNKLWLVKWDPDGDSWVNGKLVDTGFWVCCDDSGWFQPNEVQEWLTVDEVYG